MRLIQDEFTDLEVSRERKRQLRRIKRGMCLVASCKRRVAIGGRCLRCNDVFNKHRTARRERRRGDRRRT